MGSDLVGANFVEQFEPLVVGLGGTVKGLDKDEFTENDVLEVFPASSGEIAERGRPAKITYFSEDGAVLLCMFARTPISKELRRQIRDVFMKWYRARKAVLPPAQPELFPPAPPTPIGFQGVMKFITPQGEQTFNVVPVQEAAPTAVPALQFGYAGDEPPEIPHLTYDFAGACAGMHGWYRSDQIAEVVGCTEATVQRRCLAGIIPSGWRSQKKLRRWWLYIP